MILTRKEQEASELKAYKTKAAKLTSAVAIAGAAALACPAYAFASEEGGIGAILPKMNEFIPMLVAFIILWIVLAKFGWPMFDKMLEKRANTIRDDLKNAEEARQESERVLAEYKQELAEAKAQASKIIADAKQTGEDVKADITAKAQKEAADMIEKAHAAIEADKKAAKADLQASVADISVAVAAKLIGNDLSDEEHRKMIKRYVEEAGSFDAN
ncbi:ATP synthase F0 subunit B [Slackia equolifaciens]|uniref:ATP synthase subunit b n=1 Tax=Slackia equolifaciens TaxID=498718 RepID=A0A3N0B5E9_9ACTN|nr:F0F1 ATP synthase subunit B [Slackia equolifaciens]RNL42044.1 ATP synthase F0 subunit B [Slackia equolifaciens]HJF64843.1 F0F1 ATP synthase subunit B [Slackia equolifaciens]